MNRRSFLTQRWAAATALFRAKRYQALAAFVAGSEADQLRDELRSDGIDAITAKQPVSSRAGASGVMAVEVRVASAHFRRACDHISKASRPKSRRQFSLRTALIWLTIICVLLALIRQFGFFPTLWATVFISLGVLAIASGLAGVRRGRASWSWPYTRGVIIQAYIDWDGDAYSPKISYRFSVAGREYAVDTVSYMSIDIGGARAGHEMARRKVLKYPTGLDVDVFYNPLRPDHAVLERGGRFRDAILFGTIGLVFIIVGFFFLLDPLGAVG